METIVPGPAGPACVPGLLAFTLGSLGRTDQNVHRSAGLEGSGLGENPAEKEEEGREGLLVYSASSWRRRLCFSFPRLERCVAFLILSVLFREVDTMSILQIRKLRLKNRSDLQKVTPVGSGDAGCAGFENPNFVLPYTVSLRICWCCSQTRDSQRDYWSHRNQPRR